MLTSQLLYKQVPKETTLADGLALLWRHPQVLAEICELMRALRGRVQHLHLPLEEYSSVPLRVHARYTRLEILSAFGSTDRATQIAWQTGVMFLKDPQVDLLAFTLDKSAGSFSPTTRYRDYAISETLIHWESQSQTGHKSDRHAVATAAMQAAARLSCSSLGSELTNGVLVPRSGKIRESRAGAPDGDHLETRASAPRRSLRRIRSCSGLMRIRAWSRARGRFSLPRREASSPQPDSPMSKHRESVISEADAVRAYRAITTPRAVTQGDGMSVHISRVNLRPSLDR